MKKIIEPNEIILARKANIEIIKKIEDLLAGFKKVNLEKQSTDKISGKFIYSLLALKHIGEFMYGEKLSKLIEDDMAKSGLEPFEEKQ